MVLLAGCSRDNPWFYLDQDDEATSTAAATSDGTPGDAASTAGIEDTTGTTTDAAEATSGDSEAVVDTDTDATSTTTGETTTGVADTGGTADTGTTGETGMVDTTDGDPIEGEVWHDLWDLCFDSATDWQAYGLQAGALKCDTDFNNPEQWAGWLPPALYMNKLELQVLGIVPAVGFGNSITGTYQGLTLTQAKTPHLRTIVGCPIGPPMCEIMGNIRVEQDGATVVGIKDFSLGPNSSTSIDIDLSPYPMLLNGKPFSVVLVVTSKNGGPGNRGAWLHPRIVEVTQ